jgi:hypothetical protein
MRVLHLPTTVGGNSIGLSIAEREIGLHSQCLNAVSTNKFGYQADLAPTFSSLYRYGLVGQALSLFATFINHRNKYDVFHFNAGHTLLDYYPLDLNHLDIPWYPKGKRLVMTYNGSDARQNIPILKPTADVWDPLNSYNFLYDNPSLNATKKKRISIIEQYADVIFATNPDLMRFLPESAIFLPYTIAAWNQIESIPHVYKGKGLRIVHAPSNMEVKGTEYIKAAITKLQQDYSDIDFIQVGNMTHQEALVEYAKADLVIDQLLIGWYGAFAVEVMKMGKPVMVFIREDDLQFVPKQMAADCLETFINVNPLNIYDKLKEVVKNKEILQEHAHKSLEFAHRWHNPIRIAQDIMSYYQLSL